MPGIIYFKIVLLHYRKNSISATKWIRIIQQMHENNTAYSNSVFFAVVYKETFLSNCLYLISIRTSLWEDMLWLTKEEL